MFMLTTLRTLIGVMWSGVHDMNGWGWLMMSVMMLFWIALIALVVWLLANPAQRARSKRNADGAPADPRDVLDLRLARGEIGIEEHARLVKALRSTVLTNG